MTVPSTLSVSMSGYGRCRASMYGHTQRLRTNQCGDTSPRRLPRHRAKCRGSGGGLPPMQVADRDVVVLGRCAACALEVGHGGLDKCTTVCSARSSGASYAACSGQCSERRLRRVSHARAARKAHEGHASGARAACEPHEVRNGRSFDSVGRPEVGPEGAPERARLREICQGPSESRSEVGAQHRKLNES